MRAGEWGYPNGQPQLISTLPVDESDASKMESPPESKVWLSEFMSCSVVVPRNTSLTLNQ